MILLLLAIGSAVQALGLAYSLSELRRANSLLEECRSARLREKTEADRNRLRMEESINGSTAVLQRLAHGLRIRRLTRPVVLTTPPPRKP